MLWFLSSPLRDGGMERVELKLELLELEVLLLLLLLLLLVVVEELEVELVVLEQLPSSSTRMLLLLGCSNSWHFDTFINDDDGVDLLVIVLPDIVDRVVVDVDVVVVVVVVAVVIVGIGIGSMTKVRSTRHRACEKNCSALLWNPRW